MPLVDARKTSLTGPGVQNSKKNRLAASRLVDDARHRRWVKPPPPGKKLDPPLNIESVNLIESDPKRKSQALITEVCLCRVQHPNTVYKLLKKSLAIQV